MRYDVHVKHIDPAIGTDYRVIVDADSPEHAGRVALDQTLADPTNADTRSRYQTRAKAVQG